MLFIDRSFDSSIAMSIYSKTNNNSTSAIAKMYFWKKKTIMLFLSTLPPWPQTTVLAVTSYDDDRSLTIWPSDILYSSTLDRSRLNDADTILWGSIEISLDATRIDLSPRTHALCKQTIAPSPRDVRRTHDARPRRLYNIIPRRVPIPSYRSIIF